MREEIVIKVQNLSKKYTLTERHDTLLDTFKHIFKKNKEQEFWALKDISFEVKKGDILGIVGQNGAGKSTLLKVLSRISAPTLGKIEITGKIASLLEVGTGFHPELTGKENVFLYGSILGLKKKDIQAKYDDIVEFSGVGNFINVPVKKYSSGMYVRLAFAVASHIDADILIIDEVLSVGDADFQLKSFNKMKDLMKSGKTILFVSHNMESILQICTSIIKIENGLIIKSEREITNL